MTICVDFDGTVVTHEYPEVGKEAPHAVRVLKSLCEAGCKVVLNTMRFNESLEAAVTWFKDREIPLYGVNRNPDQGWTTSPKVWGDIYIDDAALGAPMTFDETQVVDWLAVEHYFKRLGILE